MNIYRHELKSYLFTTLLWIAAISGLILIYMAFYPVIQKDMESFVKMLDNLPATMKAFIGLAVNELFTPLGYYGFIFTYISLLAAIQAANLGVGIVSKEERERTVDFLLTKTVSRAGIYFYKVLAAMTILILSNVVYFIVSERTLKAYAEGSFDFKPFFMVHLSLLLIQVIFFSMGLAVSFLMKKIKTVLPISLGLVFVFYAISAFAITSKEDKLRYLTPFQFFKTEDILKTSSYESGFLFAGMLIIVVCLLTCLWMFRRKDISAI